jgi:SAM-dependent methyltransferase
MPTRTPDASGDVTGIRCSHSRDELEGEQGPMLAPAWRAQDPAALALACWQAGAADPAGAVFRERTLEGVFALAHYPEQASVPEVAAALRGNPASLARLGVWLDRHERPETGEPAIEVGCGPGRFLFELAPRCRAGVIGFDLRVGMLSLAQRLLERGTVSLPWRRDGRTFEPLAVSAPPACGGPIALVQGSLFGSALAPRVHPLVAALSLIDIVRDPDAAVAALDALVAPGGLLLIATPYQWDAAVTPPDRWWRAPEAHLCARLDALGYARLEEEAALPWAIPSHARLVHHYALHAVLARKRA